MIQKVFIRGATGNVGRELVRQIIENRDGDPLRHQNPTVIVGLESRTKGFMHCEGGIKDDHAMRFSAGCVEGSKCGNHLELLNFMVNPTVIVDVTCGKEDMRDFHLHIIKNTPHSIVTANKYPLTLCTFDQFRTLTNDYERYGFSCSVMAGAGTIHFLRNCPDLSDPVVKIQGCMSGTLGHISTCLENGQRFSEIISGAIGKYTEPHPADDLDGGDVLRKSLTLARTAGIDVAMKNVWLKPFILEEYLRERDLGKFLGRLPELDEFFAERVAEAKKEEKRLRFTSTILAGQDQEPSIIIGPEFVDADSELGRLRGTDNKVTIWTKMYKNGWTLGPVAGAGNDITARNIRDNLLDLLRGRRATALA